MAINSLLSVQTRWTNAGATGGVTLTDPGRVQVYDPASISCGSYSLGSFMLMSDAFVLQYKHLYLYGNARAALNANAEVVLTDLSPGGRLALAGRGGL